MTLPENRLKKTIRTWIILFIIGLVLSGITAFPIETQLAFGMDYLGFLPATLQHFLQYIYEAVSTTNVHYPQLAYGTDWLAFAHLVIAVGFIGPLIDPVKNIWVIQFGMIACAMVIPLALIAGPIRDIPWWWRMVDCSFGVLGIIPLYLCYRNIKKLAAVQG